MEFSKDKTAVFIFPPFIFKWDTSTSSANGVREKLGKKVGSQEYEQATLNNESEFIKHAFTLLLFIGGHCK